MLSLQNLKRDYYAGGLMLLIGLFTILIGRSYDIGTLHQMGPGLFPVILGVGMVIMGLLIAIGASVEVEGTDGSVHEPVGAPDWRGAIAIIASIVAFVLLAESAGLVIATFGTVFIAAMGDRESTLKEAFVLAVSITLFGVLLFSYLLQVNLPIWPGAFA
jgi:hypothetical protein